MEPAETSKMNAVDRINQTWTVMDELLTKKGGVGQLVNGLTAHVFSWQGKNFHGEDTSFYLFEDISGMIARSSQQHRGLHQLSRSEDGVFSMKMTDLFRYPTDGRVLVVAQTSSSTSGKVEEALQTYVKFATSKFEDGVALSLDEAWALDEVLNTLQVAVQGS